MRDRSPTTSAARGSAARGSAARSALRACRVTSWPRSSSQRAASRPRPVLEPVTNTRAMSLEDAGVGAAVEEQALAGDEPRARGTEERAGRAELRGRAEATRGDARQGVLGDDVDGHAPLPGRALLDRFHPLGVEGAGEQ